MNHDRAEAEAAELLRAFGQVEPPTSRVLEDAREALWSALAAEVLVIGAAGEQITSAGTDQANRAARRRQTDRTQDAERRRRANPGS
jgi:hypothetical protein